ncbi:type I phosphomannose isomerase catalytic subunit [Holdemanella biformis]
MEKVLFLDSPMKEKPYGSMRIQEKFGFGPMDKKIGEYWAISAHDNGLSKIKNGKYKGETLKDVYLNHRELFANDPHDKFPLLVKLMRFKNHAPYRYIQMMYMLENMKMIMVRLNSACG